MKEAQNILWTALLLLIVGAGCTSHDNSSQINAQKSNMQTAESAANAAASATANAAANAAAVAENSPVPLVPLDSSASASSKTAVLEQMEAVDSQPGPAPGKLETTPKPSETPTTNPSELILSVADPLVNQSATTPVPVNSPTLTPAVKAAAVEISISGGKKHGVILKESQVAWEADMTAFELLQKVTKEHKIQLESQGRGSFVYVQGIDNLYEFDEGAKSGWLYKVNGVVLGKSAGAYKLAVNDKIEWLYTLDLGKDVAAK